jgi:hypothetical protein
MDSERPYLLLCLILLRTYRSRIPRACQIVMPKYNARKLEIPLQYCKELK